jgi:translation elongation factor P/translation initiation factor 5A
MAAKAAAEDSRARQALASAGSSFQFMDTPEFERFVQTDARNMVALVRRIGRVE